MAGTQTVNYDGFTATRVHQRDVLNFASLGANSNKFYIIELQEGVGRSSFCIYTRYGRLGQNGREEARFFSGFYSAQEEYDRLVISKERKGYRKVDVDGSIGSRQVQVQSVSKQKAEDLSKISNKVLRLIGKLYQTATTYLVQSVETPLGKISTLQVRKGMQKLAEIEKMLDDGLAKTSPKFQWLSDEFYSTIPVIFGTKVDVQKFIINDYTKLNDRKDLLGVMQSVVQVQDSLEKTLEDKYDALGIKLKTLSSRTKEYQKIKEMVDSSHSSNHHFGVRVEDIYKIEDMAGHDRFNPYKVDTRLLFHGSRNENILSIMQGGLKIKPKSAVHTGSMFGGGIYFASEVTKSANYCWGFGNASAESHYLFVCEVATGRVRDYEDAEPGLTSAPWGYNSVRGKKGRSLLHDEYIVYKESQVKPLYIVEFKKK